MENSGYDGIFDDGVSAADLRQSLLTAVDKNPDTEAQLQSLAGRYDMPVAAVRLDPQPVERRAQLDNVPYEQIVGSLPATANLLSNPQQAAVAHDDIDNLTAIEKLFKFQSNSRRALAAGYFGFGAGAAGVLQAGAEQLQGLLEPTAGTLLPVNVAQPVADWLGRIRQNQTAWRQRFEANDGDYLSAPGGNLRNVESGYYAGLQSLSRNLLTLPLAVATDNPALALNSMAATTGGDSYGRARDAGLGANPAALYGAADAAIEYGTEQFGMGALFHSLKAGSPLLKTVGGFLAREMPGEQAATALQDMNEWLTLHPQQSLGDYLQARPAAALQTAVATLVGGGGQTALLHGLNSLISAKRQAAAAVAVESGGWLQDMSQLLQTSKLQQRAPATMQAFLDDMVMQHGDAPQHLYLNTAALRQDGVTDKLMTALPELNAQLETAQQTGSELRIPLSSWLGRVAADPQLAQALHSHLRLAGQRFSPAEAESHLADHDAAAQQAMDEAYQQLDEEAGWQESVEQVRQSVQTQLDALGKNDSKTNAAYAGLMAAYFATTAQRLGVKPVELFDASGLNFNAPARADDWLGQNPAAGGQAQPQDNPQAAADSYSHTADSPEPGNAPPFRAETDHKGADRAAAGYAEDADTDLGEEAYRGQYFPHSRTIELTDHADLSTFLHESGHFFLDMQFELTAGILKQQRQRHHGGLGQARKSARDLTDEDILKLTNNNVLPGVYASRTKLVMERTRILGSNRVTSPYEAAQALSYLYDMAVERSDALLVDSEGKPLAVVGMFKGGLREVPVNTHTLLAEAFRVKGADSIWIAHNHPGAFNRFSEGDELGNAKLAEIFKGSKLKLRGFLVYGRNYYGGKKWGYEPGPDPLDNGLFTFTHHIMPPESRVTVPVLERIYENQEIMGEALNYPLTLDYVRELSGGKSGILFANGLNLPTGFARIKTADIGTLRNNGRMDKLYRTLSMSNGVMVYIVNFGDLSRTVVYNLIGFFHNMEMPVKDLLEIEGEKMSSRRMNKFSLEYYTGFRQPPRPAEPATQLALKPGRQGPQLERRVADRPADSPPLTPEQAQALADRQAGLLLLDGLRQPQAFLPYARAADAYVQHQLTQMLDAKAAMLVNDGGLSAAEHAELLNFFESLGLPVSALAEAAAGHGGAESADSAAKSQSDAQPLSAAHARIVEDTAILLDWFGVETLEDWNSLDLDGKRPYHEQFARGFERYLFEGRAPSEGLQGVFERFRLWLISVYQSLRNLNIQLGDAARQVMDRMLASDAEIRQAQQARGMRKLFLSARQAGMSEDAFAAYQALNRKAEQAASAGLQQLALADMQWLQQARNSSLQRLQAQHETLRNRIRGEMSAVVNAMPVYRAKAFMDAQPDGWHADVLADMFGFGSGDELQQRLAAAEPAEALIERWTDAKLLEENATLATLPALRRAADAEAHNQLRGLCIATEAEALAKAAGEIRFYGNSVDHYLQRRLEAQAFDQLWPEQYARAETRAADESAAAFKRGELQAAAVTKRRQLLAFHATRHAYRLLDELDAGLQAFDRHAEAALQLPVEYRQQINGLLQRFADGMPSRQPVSLAQWRESQQSAGFAADMAGFLLDPQLYLPYKKLNVKQLRDLLSALQQIEYLGRQSQAGQVGHE